jgi:isopenicillin N synthase-like dioxygenase
MIPDIDLAAVTAGDAQARDRLRHAAEETGFLTLSGTAIPRDEVLRVIAAYRAFFALPEAEKRAVDMARTGANRGWGAPGAERVDPAANPDYKQVFDCGLTLAENDPLRAAGLAVYAPNLWPEGMPEFRSAIEGYYIRACAVARDLLRGIAGAIGADEGYFDARFDRPMALLRGNYYPPRPGWAGDRDFGIGAHTDYGCLTLLATDGVPGLEVQGRDGAWHGVTAEPGRFVVNFGEMLEVWTTGRVRATPHRVMGSARERISIPLFFNPNHDANVAPMGSGEVILAGDYLQRRFDETYLHLRRA